ncbi:MAG TPA: hypothetical protein VEB03_00440 [Candidatus Nanoarchaeia archaeon]|nr:hypothetical protein [Candidatus Nanoarchaeia archaeon]
MPQEGQAVDAMGRLGPGRISRRSEGFLHPPEADIESIRQLLEGYGTSRGILKELIQNAEDAGATRMDLLYVPGSPNALQDLLKVPGLLVANDGVFTEEHRTAIKQISLGTKGTDDRAIGRFGKGLKSVFAWCEAFFIVARTQNQPGWTNPYVADLFNPWTGWRHEEWNQQCESYADSLVSEVERYLESFYPRDKAWLAFWFPLRARPSDPSEDCIWQSFPGDDPNFCAQLCSELSQLTSSLVTLREIRKISLTDLRSNSSPIASVSFDPDNRRLPRPEEPADSAVEGHVNLLLPGSENHRFVFSGIAGRLPEPEIAHLKEASGWPRVVRRTSTGADTSCRAKGVPQYAAILSSEPCAQHEPGSLDVRWCVFFPVGKQSAENGQLTLQHIRQHITLNLHGFFFLDSERLRIDGLEDGFKSNGNTGSKLYVDWNRVIASRGTLARVPEVLDHFSTHQSLNADQCKEFAGVIRQSSLWRTFAEHICSIHAWIPRWRSGEETWELLPAETRVHLIPKANSTESLIVQIPSLQRLSQRLALVIGTDESTLHGLWVGKPSNWTEQEVLEVLDGVTIGTADSDTALWLNSFLDYVHDHGGLSSAVRQRALELPLLTVRGIDSQSRTLITGERWFELRQCQMLFAESGNPKWIRLLADSLPNWTCFLCSATPRWFREQVPASCNAATAAQIVLNQEALGEFASCKKLVEALLPEVAFGRAIAPAIRFLMHGNVGHKGDTKEVLFVAEGSQNVWARVLEQLFEEQGGSQSWRLLAREWMPVLSPQAQLDINVSAVDANGVWTELTTNEVFVPQLVFPPATWSTLDICALFEGLYQAGKSNSDSERSLCILRKLHIHALRGRDQRISIADIGGQLSDDFILNAPGFDNGIPECVQPLWKLFLSDAYIVETLPSDSFAATVQRNLFQKTDSEGDKFTAELDWNHVVRRCLNATDAAKWAPLLMEALSRGDQSIRGLGQKLKKTKWIPLKLGGNIAPDSVIYIDALEDDLDRLLQPGKDGLAGLRSLKDSVTGHKGFATLRNYLPKIEQAIEMLGLWLAEKPDWSLGLSKHCTLNELDPILAQLEEVPAVPIAALIRKCRAARVRGYEEGIDSLINEHLLPATLRPFDYTSGGIEKIESVLHALEGQQNRAGFDAYLAQACNDGVLKEILPRLRLVNQRNQWRDADELIWPSTNLDPAAQVCNEHARILAPLHHGAMPQAIEGADTLQGPPSATRVLQLEDAPDFDRETEKLREYLEPFRTGNLGESLPATFVAALGGHPSIRALLHEMLHSGVGVDVESFIAWLLGEKTDALRESLASARFVFEIISGETATALTITGKETSVGFTSDVSSLIVGDPSDLWFTLYYRGRMETGCHRLRLRWIPNPDKLDDAVAVFARTVETIILKVYCNGVAAICPDNIPEVLSQIAGAGQSDLRRSQTYLLDMAEARLKELGVRDVPQLNSVLQKFSEARNARVEAELIANNAPNRSKQLITEAEHLLKLAKYELLQLLGAEQENATQLRLVDAVRRKMTDYQYSVESLPFELFQNADDAVAELEEMQRATLSQARQFTLLVDDQHRSIDVVHWGRPINRYEYPGFSEGLKRGYDQDLQKMLTLNFSDKGVDAESTPGLVTGRFGLGFKSVFFFSQQPEIISGRLAFCVKGGFFPVALSPQVAEDVRAVAPPASNPGLIPTIIRLASANHIREAETAKAIRVFAEKAPLLTIFSRRIRTLSIMQGSQKTEWTASEVQLTRDGSAVVACVGARQFLCFRCSLASDDRPATVLLQLESSGVTALPAEWAGLWITTPTAERSELRFALNAPFKPDAGRLRLAVNNTQNRTIADEVAQGWGDSLIELFDVSKSSWSEIDGRMKLHAGATHESFWAQIWHELTRTAPVTAWNAIQNGGQVLSWICWAQPQGAVRRLVRERAVIPSELPGPYKALLKVEHLRFSVSGLMADLGNGTFAEVAQWSSTLTAFPPGMTVHSSVSAFLTSANLLITAEALTLPRVLAASVGPENEADYAQADRLGRFINSCKALFELRSAYGAEVQQAIDWMKQVKVRAGDNKFHTASELVCARSVAEMIERDEVLRAAFAPDSAVLSSGYSDPALAFFVKARGQLSAGAPTLAKWARDAADDKLKAVFHYLVVGELGQQLADQLKRPWLDIKSHTPGWNELSDEERSEIERKFARGHASAPEFKPVWNPPPPEPVMDPQLALRRVSEWWQDARSSLTDRYEAKTYPSGFPGTLPWPGEDEWDSKSQPNAQARWLLLFIQASLVPLGFNMIGRDHGFSQFLTNKGWLDVLADVPNNPDALVSVLDEYLGAYVQNTKYHFQMRQFVCFYAVAKNLESLLLSLRETERSESPTSFRLALSPRANPLLNGTGIDAPALDGMLGIGACQLIRELYRVGRLKNPAGHGFAFTPIRKVRRLCYQLFEIPEGDCSVAMSQAIYRGLQRVGDDLDVDVTFGSCFDLPLQFLAQDKTLRTEVLNVDFDLIVDEDPDAAP